MGEARWLPLFVTADVSVDIIDSVLRSSAAEKEEDEDFENRWSLVEHPSQETVTKPSVAPVGTSFQSGFTDASIETLQQFVTTRCGGNGLGHDNGIYMDWLADDAFGVIDARTAQDNTILFVIQETVDAVQEAEVRVAWDKGTKSDELLLTYMQNAADMNDQDTMFLFENVVNDKDKPAWTRAVDRGLDEVRQEIDDWINTEQQGARPKWFEIRMVVENAMKNSCGIWNIGPVAVLTEMKEQFDEDGIMRY